MSYNFVVPRLRNASQMLVSWWVGRGIKNLPQCWHLPLAMLLFPTILHVIDLVWLWGWGFLLQLYLLSSWKGHKICRGLPSDVVLSCSRLVNWLIHDSTDELSEESLHVLTISLECRSAFTSVFHAPLLFNGSGILRLWTKKQKIGWRSRMPAPHSFFDSKASV